MWTRAALVNEYPGRTGEYLARFTFVTETNVTTHEVHFEPPNGDPGADAWVFGQTLFTPTSPTKTVKVELGHYLCSA